MSVKDHKIILLISKIDLSTFNTMRMSTYWFEKKNRKTNFYRKTVVFQNKLILANTCYIFRCVMPYFRCQ